MSLDALSLDPLSLDVLYRTSAIATGGRQGRVRSLDGRFDAPLAMPQALGGAGGEGLNPELLFAAGYAACFGSALQYVAAQKGVSGLHDIQVQAEVGIGPRSAGGFGLTVALQISVRGIGADLAQALVADAHAGCPYSNATRGNVEVSLHVTAD